MGEHAENTNFDRISNISFLFKHDLLFSLGHLLESKGRFVNLFGDFSHLWAVAGLLDPGV